MTWHQAVQDYVGRRGHKRLARRIFRARVRYFVWRGKVLSARVVGDDD